MPSFINFSGNNGVHTVTVQFGINFIQCHTPVLNPIMNNCFELKSENSLSFSTFHPIGFKVRLQVGLLRFFSTMFKFNIWDGGENISQMREAFYT